MLLKGIELSVALQVIESQSAHLQYTSKVWELVYIYMTTNDIFNKSFVW